MRTPLTAPDLIYTTWPDENAATSAARHLLTEKLIACCNIFPSGRSLYMWEGEIQDDAETVAIFKTTSALARQVCDRLKALHTYDVPAIIHLPASDTASLEAYSTWVHQCVSA